MRVILVNKFHYRKGGSETYYFAVADALREMGHEVHFFAMEDERNIPCKDADLFVPNRDYNGPSSPVAKASAALSIIYSGEAKQRFQTLCERVRPDVVHMNLVHRQITLSILDAPYLKEHNVPVVWTAHDSIGICPNYTMLDGMGNVCDACVSGHSINCLKRKCVKGSIVKSGLAVLEATYLSATRTYEKIDRIICPSRFLEGKMIEGGFSENQLITMPNFIPDGELDRWMSVFHRHTECKSLIFFGRLSREKGPDIALEAFSEAIFGLPKDCNLLMVGNGPMRERLEQRAHELHLDDRVEFCGFKSGFELKSLVGGSLFSIASSACHENMPFSVVESLAAGTPVIGSRMGGIPELVTDRQTGFTFTSGDTAGLADLLCSALRLPNDDYERMQRAGRDLARERCSQTAYMRKLIDLYTSLIHEKKGN